MTIAILIGLGLCFGSFSEALIWRIHEQSKPKKKRIISNRDLSITKGRSMCARCYRRLEWYDLLPLFSWLSLKGKCRYCHAPIGWQAPLLELATASLFVVSYLVWPGGQPRQIEAWVLYCFWSVILVGLVALVVYDMRWMLLPDRIVYFLLGLVLVRLIVQATFLHGGLGLVTSAIWGFLCLGGLFYVLFQVSDGKWIGGGDVKLGFVLGILVGGPLSSLLLLFIASSAGSLASIPLLLASKLKKSSRLPFGPLLIVATIIVVLFGTNIIHWYKTKVIGIY